MKRYFQSMIQSCKRLLAFWVNKYLERKLFYKVFKTIAAVFIMLAVLNCIVFFLSPRKGWVSVNSDSTFNLNIKSETISASNSSHMLSFLPFQDSTIDLTVLADKYRLYDQQGNIIEQTNESEILNLSLSRREEILISSGKRNDDSVEYNLFTTSRSNFIQEKDVVYLNDGFQEYINFEPNGSVTVQTCLGKEGESWKIDFPNSNNFSTLECQGDIYVSVENCYSFRIIRGGKFPISDLSENWCFSYVTGCSAQLIGNVNVKVSSMSLDYQIANQPLFVGGDELTGILEVNEKSACEFALVGQSNKLELGGENIFPSFSNLIFANIWSFLALLIAPFSTFVFSIWYPLGKDKR